ncbi:Thioredoxin-like, putative [Leishmania lindenbergi]|uniref:Thioredoxin-like n=1 Tax=Leishmania lindenbergi TaxID=651832 RepID=A0AAW3ARD6_9TRYP
MTDIDVKTYSDDASLGKEAPKVDSTHPIKGGNLTIEVDKVYVLYFFNTFYRGADVCNDEFTVLSEEMGDKVVFVGISTDADIAKTEKYLGKEIIDENTKKQLRLSPPHIVYDEGKVVSKNYAAVSNLSVMSCPMAFVIKDGKVVWRQQFLQAHTVNQSNFREQLSHVLAGEELESNGPRPKVEIEEEEAEGIDGEMSLF